MQVLSRHTPGSPFLVGESGAGKTAIVEGLAQRLVTGNVAAPFKGSLVYRIDVGTIAENSASQDDLDKRLYAILEDVRVRGNVILFLDELRVRTKDIWRAFKPVLVRGGMQMIGALTADDYTAILDEHPALQRTLVPVQVAELTVPDTIEVLRGLRNRYEIHHRATITDDALVAAAELSDRRLPGRRLPGKAIDLIDEAAALCRIRSKPFVPDLREYDEQIARVRAEQELAIDTQDFEKAVQLRSRERELLARKADAEKEEGPIGEVDEGLIAETLAIMLGLSSEGAGDVPEVPPFAVAVMTDDDREVWGLA